MTIAGCDFDVHAIHVVRLELDSDDARYDRIRLDVGPGNYIERARRMRDLLPNRAAWNDQGVALIAIEEPKGQYFKGSIPLAVILGALLACLPRQETTPVLMVPTQEWKKWSVGGGFPGHGNAKKEEVARWALERWPNVLGQAAAGNQNALDAYCIASAARALSAHHASRGLAA